MQNVHAKVTSHTCAQNDWKVSSKCAATSPSARLPNITVRSEYCGVPRISATPSSRDPACCLHHSNATWQPMLYPTTVTCATDANPLKRGKKKIYMDDDVSLIARSEIKIDSPVIHVFEHQLHVLRE